jgi:prepilin-type N-terminal cleavage/methylation domain-containing protein
MKTKTTNLRNGGFSMVETLVSVLILGIVFSAGMSAIAFSRLARHDQMERSIMTGFALHYAELLRAVPFSDLKPGQPLNSMFDDKAHGIFLGLPPNGEWQSITNATLLQFHPELVWIRELDPRLKMEMVPSSANPQNQKEIRLTVDWVRPLAAARSHLDLNLVRVKDL